MNKIDVSYRVSVAGSLAHSFCNAMQLFLVSGLHQYPHDSSCNFLPGVVCQIHFGSATVSRRYAGAPAMRKSWFACTAFFWEESEFEFACTIMMETCQICYKTKVAGRTVVSGPNVKCFNLKEVKDTCCSTETIRIFDPGGEELLSVEVNGHQFAADLFDQLMPLVIPRGFVLSDGLQLSLYVVHNEERVFYRDVILGGLDLNLYVSES